MNRPSGTTVFTAGLAAIVIGGMISNRFAERAEVGPLGGSETSSPGLVLAEKRLGYLLNGKAWRSGLGPAEETSDEPAAPSAPSEALLPELHSATDRPQQVKATIPVMQSNPAPGAVVLPPQPSPAAEEDLVRPEQPIEPAGRAVAPAPEGRMGLAGPQASSRPVAARREPVPIPANVSPATSVAPAMSGPLPLPQSKPFGPALLKYLDEMSAN
jgi:hypothetical protein